MLNIFKAREKKILGFTEEEWTNYFDENNKEAQNYKKECIRNLGKERVTGDQVIISHC